MKVACAAASPSSTFVSQARWRSVQARPLEADLVPEQELREPVPGPHQVLTDVLAGADQVAERLLGRTGDANRMELARQQQADQVLGIAAVGLDLVARSAGDLAGCGDHALDAGYVERSREPVAGRAGLIAGPHWPFERAQEPHHWP
jgi:hypothetical protein